MYSSFLNFFSSSFHLNGCKFWGSCCGSVCISWKQLALWWHHGGITGGSWCGQTWRMYLCTSDVLGCAGTQWLLAHQPPWSLPPVGLTPYTPFCLLSSALFHFSGKPLPWSAMSQLTAGQGELPGQAVLENNKTKSDLSQQSWYFNIFALHHLREMVISYTGVMGTDASLGLLSPLKVRPPGPSL